MDVSYGRFPRGLAIVSGIVAIYLALAALISHPLGFVGSAVIMLIWGCFLKVVSFAFEPSSFRVLTEEPKREKPSLQELGPKELGDWSEIAASILSIPEPEEVSSRILPGSNRGQVSENRVLGKTYQEVESPEDAERREDRAWADMFRAL